MGKFKIGDRVKLVESRDYNGDGKYGKTGEEGVVLRHDNYDNSYQVAFVDSGTWWAEEGNLDLAFKIEVGKFYKMRDGRKVGPMERFDSGQGNWKAPRVGGFGPYWWDSGEFHIGEKNPFDLIAEWVDEPAVAVAASNDNATKPKFEVGDRVNYTLTRSDWQDMVITEVKDGIFYAVKNDGVSGGFREDWLELVTTPTNPAIVALIENGQPRPSVKPFVHADEASASKEAARLAGKHKGQSFGVYVLTQTVKEEVVYTYKHEWQRLAANGEKISAIKALREITGLGLKATKDAVEHWIANDQQYSRIAA